MSFWIEREKRGKGELLSAHLELRPVIAIVEETSDGKAAPRLLYEPSPLSDRETIASDKLSGSSVRRKKVARRVLERVVKKFLAAPELEKTLLASLGPENPPK